jgi:hypothetical protein
MLIVGEPGSSRRKARAGGGKSGAPAPELR